MADPLDVEVPGIHRVAIPVPYPLKTVNCYLAEGEDGWALVDCGAHTEEAKASWRATFRRFGVGPGELRRIYVTHFHPDHLGLAGWLQETTGAEVYVHGPDFAWAEYQWAPPVRQAFAIEDLFVRHGAPKTFAEAIRQQFIEQRQDSTPLPEAPVRLCAADAVELGGRRFELVLAAGHADHMVMLWNEEERLLLGADAILPHISPNVGVWPGGRPNPLADFLATLRTIAALAPRLTLPGHGRPIGDTRSRVAELLAHHERRLAEMAALLAGGLETAYQVADRYFGLAALSAHQARFATAETIAHLEYLTAEGVLERLDGDVTRYRPRRVPAPAAEVGPE